MNRKLGRYHRGNKKLWIEES